MFETSAEVLDALRAKLKAHSDREIARILGVTHTTVNQWRQGKSAMSPAVAVRVAELLEVDPALLLIQRYVEAEKDPAAKAIMTKLAAQLRAAARRAKKVAAVAALACAGLIGLSTPQPSHAAASIEGKSMYIMSYCGCEFFGRRSRCSHRAFLGTTPCLFGNAHLHG
jgi:Plasmid maintenance system antidote protein